MQSILDRAREHLVFVVHVASLVWLLVAFTLFTIGTTGGWSDVLMLACFIALLVGLYVTFWSGLRRMLPPQYTDAANNSSREFERWQRILFVALIAIYIAVVIGHFISLGYIPVFEIWEMDTETNISLVRQGGYFDLPSWLRYASDYAVKSLGPVLLLVAYWYRSRLFWLILVVGLFYAIALFARILPVLLLLPLLISMVLGRKWLHVTLVLVLLIGSVYAVTMAASPAIRDSSAITRSFEAAKGNFDGRTRAITEQAIRDWMSRGDEASKESWKNTSVVYALYERALFVPGRVIGQWFNFYGHPELREHGCGYRPVAAVLDCEYVPVPSKLYSVYYPENYKAGMTGSLNAASFMFEYANFGPMGFLLSAFMGGLLFIVIRLIYVTHPLALPLNIPLILVIMENSLLTAINSGAGWLLTTALFILFYRVKKLW